MLGSKKTRLAENLLVPSGGKNHSITVEETGGRSPKKSVKKVEGGKRVGGSKTHKNGDRGAHELARQKSISPRRGKKSSVHLLCVRTVP